MNIRKFDQCDFYLVCPDQWASESQKQMAEIAIEYANDINQRRPWIENVTPEIREAISDVWRETKPGLIDDDTGLAAPEFMEKGAQHIVPNSCTIIDHEQYRALETAEDILDRQIQVKYVAGDSLARTGKKKPATVRRAIIHGHYALENEKSYLGGQPGTDEAFRPIHTKKTAGRPIYKVILAGELNLE